MAGAPIEWDSALTRHLGKRSVGAMSQFWSGSMKRLIVAFAALLAIAFPTIAQEILKKEPAAGVLRYGEKVLVESRKCSKGQVMEVTGGRMPSRGTRNTLAPSTPRERRCVPRA